MSKSALPVKFLIFAVLSVTYNLKEILVGSGTAQTHGIFN